MEHDLLAAVTGASVLSGIVLGLSLLHAAVPAVFVALGVSLLISGWKFGARPEGTAGAGVELRQGIALGALVLPFVLLYLSVALSPEHSPDGQTYHLGLVYRFFREHGMSPLRNMYAVIPLGMEMLFLFAFSFGRHAAAAAVHGTALFALPALMAAYGRRLGMPGVGVCAGLLVFLAPVVGADGASAYNDVALATAWFAMFYLLEIWREEPEAGRALLVPAGLLAGFCFALKYTGFTAVLYAAGVVLWHRKPRALLPVGLAASLIALPWPVKNWFWADNPFSPLMNGLFPNPYIHVAFEDNLRAHFRHYGLASLRTLPWEVTVTGNVGGQLGPLFLLAPLGLLALRTAGGRRWLLAMAVALLPYPENIGTRFLIPALPFAALAMVRAFGSSWRIQTALVALMALLCWPKVVARYTGPGSMRIERMDWKPALGITPEDEFLRRRSPDYRVARLVDQHVPPGHLLWSAQPLAEAYLRSDVLVSFQSAEGEVIQDIVATGADRSDFEPTWNLRFTFAPLRIQHLRVTQNARSATDTWSIGEIYLYNGGAEVRPQPAWQVDAAPFPWNLGMAFDRNPATRWNSWQSIEPGMHVDLDMKSAVLLDRVELHCAHDQWKIQPALENCDGASCVPVRAQLARLDLLRPSGIRSRAAQALKARGVEYLLIPDTDWKAPDLAANKALWGLTQVAEVDGKRLYRLE